MAAGFLYGGVCYASSLEAQHGFYSKASPAFTSGTTSYLNEFVWSGTLWQIKQYSISSTGVVTTRSTSTAPVPTFPSCDTLTTLQDGFVLGWLIVGVWIAAWAFSAMRRGAE